jgi:hypothetical protein
MTLEQIYLRDNNKLVINKNSLRSQLSIVEATDIVESENNGVCYKLKLQRSRVLIRHL